MDLPFLLRIIPSKPKSNKKLFRLNQSLLGHARKIFRLCPAETKPFIWPSENFYPGLRRIKIIWTRLSPRPISDCQLNALPHLHPSPIYLVFFKGPF